jgi:hypothetical protein
MSQSLIKKFNSLPDPAREIIASEGLMSGVQEGDLSVILIRKAEWRESLRHVAEPITKARPLCSRGR